MLIFDERGKLEYQGKTSHSRVENQQTRSTYDGVCGNWTRSILVEGKCSQHYPTMIYMRWIKQHWILVTFLSDFIWKQHNFDTYLKHYKKTIQRNSKVKCKSPAERYKEFIALEFSRTSNIFSSMQMHILLCQVSILIISKFLAQDNDFPSLWLVPQAHDMSHYR